MPDVFRIFIAFPLPLPAKPASAAGIFSVLFLKHIARWEFRSSVAINLNGKLAPDG